MGLKRKIKRNKVKKVKKDFKKSLNLFHSIPDRCSVCEESFDKSNKEQVKTWNVAVREKQNTINLYCPSCWGKAKKLINDIKEQLGEQEASI